MTCIFSVRYYYIYLMNILTLQTNARPTQTMYPAFIKKLNFKVCPGCRGGNSSFVILLLISLSCLWFVPSMSQTRFSMETLDSLAQANRIRNPELSRRYAVQAMVQAKQGKNPKELAQAYLINGMSCSSNYMDSGFLFYNKALRIFDSINYTLGKIRVLYSLGSLYDDVSDYKTAMLLYDSCYKLAEREGIARFMTCTLTSMGNLNLDMMDSVTACKQYKASLDIAIKEGLPLDQGIAIGNLAGFEISRELKFRMIKQAIDILSKIPVAKEEEAQFLVNIGIAETDPDQAMKYFTKALDIANRSDLRITRIAVLNNMAYAYLALGDIAKAADCLINKAIPEAKGINNSDWLATVYDSYADVLKAGKDFKQALKYKELGIAERQKADYLKAASEVRFLGAVLDSKNKEITIQKNTTAIAAQKNLIRRQFLLLLLAGTVILAFIFLVIIILQKTRLRIKTQQVLVSRQILELEEKEKMSVSRELHDTVSNLVEKLNGHILSLNIGQEGLQEEIREKLRELSNSIRRISHRIQGVNFEESNLSDLITELCFDMSNLTGLVVNCSVDQGFPRLEFEKAKLLYRITEELLNNASKYAKGSSVLINLKAESGQIVLTYCDDGPGFPDTASGKAGIGLKNIKERARLLGGQALCSSSPGNGVDWQISFPYTNMGGNMQ